MKIFQLFQLLHLFFIMKADCRKKKMGTHNPKSVGKRYKNAAHNGWRLLKNS